MTVSVAQQRPRFYFALPRLAARLCGGSGVRSSQSFGEAHGVSVLIFTVTWLFAWRLAGSGHSLGFNVATLILLVPALFIWWLFALTANWLAICTTHSLGWFRAVPNDRCQGVCIIAETTVFAAVLVRHDGWPAVVGAAWLIGVALNLMSAVLLAVIDATSRRPTH